MPTLVFPLKVKCHFPADLPRLSPVIPSSGLDLSTFCRGALFHNALRDLCAGGGGRDFSWRIRRYAGMPLQSGTANAATRIAAAIQRVSGFLNHTKTASTKAMTETATIEKNSVRISTFAASQFQPQPTQ